MQLLFRSEMLGVLAYNAAVVSFVLTRRMTTQGNAGETKFLRRHHQQQQQSQQAAAAAAVAAAVQQQQQGHLLALILPCQHFTRTLGT
jgi:hypothetical protein